MNYERYKSAESRQEKSSFKSVSNRNRKVNQDFRCLQMSFGFLMFEYAAKPRKKQIQHLIEY